MGTDAHFTAGFVHRLRFTRGVLDPSNPVLGEALEPGVIGAAGRRVARALVVVDDGVAACWPGLGDRVAAYAAAWEGRAGGTVGRGGRIEIAGPVLEVPGGEASKSGTGTVDAVMRAIHERKICRHSYVVAIGGGAALDAVGFAAATAHRGVRLVRLPTTTLAQDDSGVGVKNGINAFGKKNFIGAFSVPWAVINDELFLTTLPRRDWLAGLSEAVKVAVIKDAALFDRIVSATEGIRRRDLRATMPIIERSARLHLEHIVGGGDPFEQGTARPLDFGHWSAHRLEQMTGFALRHGEAVSIGIALDVVYATLAGMLDAEVGRRVRRCLAELGLPTHHAAMRDGEALLGGLEDFREHLGGELSITMPRAIGVSEEVHQIDPGLMLRAIDLLAGEEERAGAANGAHAGPAAPGGSSCGCRCGAGGSVAEGNGAGAAGCGALGEAGRGSGTM